MPETIPRLTYVIASRNDNFCGNNLERLQRTLQHISANHNEAETIVVDWGSIQPLELILPGMARFIYVPKHVTNTYATNFNEVLALNIGIKRARAPWIGRLDQDTLVGPKFVEWFRKNDDESQNFPPERTFAGFPAYFSRRRELGPNEIHTDPSLAQPWGEWPIDHPNFFRAAVGIVLAPANLWHFTRGYDERLIYRNHMEHDLCLRFRKLVGLHNLDMIIPCDFYHQHHERCTPRPENFCFEPDVIERDLKVSVNDRNWGLGTTELEETTL